MPTHRLDREWEVSPLVDRWEQRHGQRLAAAGPGSRHTWRLSDVTTGAFLNRRRMPAALVPVTSASTTRRHRRSAHGPHSTASAPPQ